MHDDFLMSLVSVIVRLRRLHLRSYVCAYAGDNPGFP